MEAMSEKDAKSAELADSSVSSTEACSVVGSEVAHEQADQFQIHKLESRLSRAQSAAASRRGPEHLAPETETETDQNDDVRKIHGLRWLGICVALYISCFLYGLDTTIAADVQGSVVERFGHVEQLSWIGSGFPLGSVAVIIPTAALYTSFNMKWLFIGSVLIFEAGSALCGGAPSMSALIVGRVIAGVGGTGLYLGVLYHLTALTTKEERGRYMALIGLTWGGGAVLGPVIGGAFAVSSATWRWAFYINLVVGAVLAPLFIFALPSIHPVVGVPVKTRIANLDFLGFLLNIGIWVSFMIAATMGGGQWPWDDGRTIATFVVFGVLVACYILQQYFCILTTPETRSFPVNLLRSRTQLVIYASLSANSNSLFVVVYFIPIYFQFVHGDSAIMAAVRLLPFIVIVVVAQLAVGHFLPRIQYYSVIYLVSGVFITLGNALLYAYLEPATPIPHIYGFSILAAVGTGMTNSVSYAVASLKVPAEEAGDSVTFQNIGQVGGSAISLAIAGQVFHSAAVHNLRAALAGQGFTAADIEGAIAGAQSVIFETLTGSLRDAATRAITDAMQKTFILAIVAGSLTVVCGMALKFERLFMDPSRVVAGA